jgi:hypothetical protein
MRFLAPSAQSSKSSPPDPGLPRPVRSVLRVSHPLDGFLLDKPSRPCCMPVRSWSSTPYRAFSSLGAVPPLDGLCPLALHRVPDRVAGGCPRSCRTGRTAGGSRPLRVASRLCSPSRVRRCDARREAGGELEALLGFGPLQGLASSTSCRVLPPGSSLELSVRTAASASAEADPPRRCDPGSPESSQGRDLPCSAQHSGPSWGFPPHRIPHQFESGPVLAHGFASGATRRRRSVTVPLRTAAHSLPGLGRPSCRWRLS